MRTVCVTLFAVALATMGMGCTTVQASKDYVSSDTLGFQWDIDESASLFPSDRALLSDEDIDRILSGSITLPKDARVSLARIDRRWWSADEILTERASANEALSIIQSADRVREAVLLPRLLIPEDPNVPSIREAAARYQSDMVFIYAVTVDTMDRYRWTSKDKVRAYSLVDAVLLDIRTGIVPFTNQQIEEFEVVESSADFSWSETRARATSTATRNAVIAATKELAAFMDAQP